MPNEYRVKVQALVPAKALAIAAYGESVAAYRYRTLAEKSPDAVHHDTFVEMALEEQTHHIRVQGLLRKTFPDSDFVLSAVDKELAIVGPRQLELTNRSSYDKALHLIYESELLTGRFYLTLHEIVTRDELRPLLKEMGNECLQHAERVKALFAAE